MPAIVIASETYIKNGPTGPFFLIPTESRAWPAPTRLLTPYIGDSPLAPLA
jgi:hypothetical protein